MFFDISIVLIFVSGLYFQVYNLDLRIVLISCRNSRKRAMSSVPSAPEILSLFRSLLRVARQFPDYNIKEYTKRRTIDAFRENATLSDPASISSAFSHGKTQLQVAKRQSIVYSLYAPHLPSIMEHQTPL
ncbi:hypothetical protein RJT34_18341 [Clitoria ternatea]|uniref:Complex 1 LYR protein domain-containing protein n=1 Tax=Clitoria ternatea TaxID=43366 RepID=A0AAN9JBC1_CLITE